MEPSTVSARLIGAMFLEKGLISQEQLESALQEQRTTGERLGEILVERFGISRLDLASALAEQWAEYERPTAAEPQETNDEPYLAAVSSEWNGTEASASPPASPEPRRPIGEIFLERGLLTAAQLEQALAEQGQTGERLGEILVARGVVSRLELASALADQWASLQKLRPPKPAQEPEHGEPGEPAVGDAGDLRAQVADLASRVDVSEQRLAGADPAQELQSSIDALAAKVDGLLEAPARREADAVASLGARLDELSARLDGLAAAPVPVDPEVVASLGARLDGLSARLDGLAAAPVPVDPEVVASLGARLDGLSARLDGLSAGPAADALVAPLRSEIDALGSRLGELASRADESHAATEALARLEPALAALARRVDDLAGSAPTAPETEEVDQLRTVLASMEARLDEIGASTDVAAALDQRVAALEGRPAAPQEFDSMRTAVIELNARVAKLAAQPTADEVVNSIRTQLATLTAKVNDLATEAESGAATESAIGSDALATLENALTALAGRVDGLAETVAGAPSPGEAIRPVRAEVIALGERTDRLADSLAQRVDQLGHAVAAIQSTEESVAPLRAALEARLAALESRPAEPPVLEEVREAVSALGARVAELADPAGAREVDERLDAVEARLRDTAAIDRLGADLEELARRVEELGRVDSAALSGRLDAAEGQVETAIRAVADADGLAAELRSRVDELTTRTHERDRAVDALGTGAAELHELVTDIANRVEEAGPPDVEALLGERLRGIEARVAHAVDAEGRLRDALETLVDVATARLDEEQRLLRESFEAQLDELVRPLPGGLEDVRSRLEELAARQSRIEGLEQRLDGTAGADELRDGLAGLSARLDEMDGQGSSGRDAMREELAAVRSALEAETRSLEERLGARLDESAEVVSGLAAGTERIEELERRLAEHADVEGRLRDTLAPLDEAAAAIREEQEALRGRLAEALQRLSSVDSVAGRLAELELRLSEGERLEQRLRESFDTRLEESVAPLLGGLGELRSRLEDLAAAGVGSEAIAEVLDRIEGLERRPDAAAGVAELRDGLAELSGRLDALGGQGSSDVEALRGELAGVRSALEARPADLERLRESFDTRLEESVAPLLGGLGELRARLEELGTAGVGSEELAEVLGRLEGLEQRLDASAGAAELREGLDGLSARLDEVGGQGSSGTEALREELAAARSALEARQSDAEQRLWELLEARLAESVAPLPGEIGDVRSQLEELLAAGAGAEATAVVLGRVEELERRLDAAASEATAHDEMHRELHGIEHRLRELLEAQERRLGDHEGRLGELAERQASRLETESGLASRVDALRERLEGLAPADELRDGLAKLQARLDELSGDAGEAIAALRHELDGFRTAMGAGSADLEERLRAAVEETSSRAVEVERGAREDEARELRDQLRSHAERLTQAGSSADLAALGAELRGAVDELRAELAAERDQAAEAVARVERTIAEVREEQQRHVRVAAEREAASEGAVEAIGGLNDRLSALERRGGAEIEPALGEIHEQLAALVTRLDESERHAADAHAALGLALEGVDARLEDAALRSAEHAAAIEHAVRRELESLAATAEERDAAAIDARAEVREELERAASSLGWRIEKVEEALAGEDRDELRGIVSSLEHRLDVQAAQADELVRLTEKALRKGLASLGSRLSESEEAYVEAGNALRRSIERLGLAVREADQRTAPDGAEPDVAEPAVAEPAVAEPAVAEESYLAFAPVGEAYRLVELKGFAPEVGDEVVLPDGAGGLVATRVSRSPLPFDSRSCVYLERRQPVVAD